MDIAYQVIGDGAHDLVVLPSALISIDSIAAEPSMNRFHLRLASFCRVIRFDHRGTGLSSRVQSIDVIGPQFWAEDAIAVMDAVGCPTATIFVSGWASMNGLVLAANYPDRVNGLVIVNGFARFLWVEEILRIEALVGGGMGYVSGYCVLCCGAACLGLRVRGGRSVWECLEHVVAHRV